MAKVSAAAPAAESEEEGIGLAVGQELTEENPFLGVVMVDETTPNRYQENRKNLHLSVLPVDFEVRGETGMFHEYYPASTRIHSKMGALLVALGAPTGGDKRGAPLVRKGTKLGAGQLKGLVCYWVRRDLKFGRDQAGQDMVAEGVLVPFPAQVPSADDLSRGKARAAAGPTAKLGSGAGAPAAQVPEEFSDGEIVAMLGVIEGLGPKESMRAAIKAKGLSQAVKQSLVSGKGQEWLVEHGYAALDDLGNYVAVDDEAEDDTGEEEGEE